ncbi:MAG: hypothetical protein K8R36_23595 [Planctomycetales bacterium]|nr:hypothetical protein [Planctomycetales bacterium]
MMIPTNFLRRLVACAASGAVIAGSLASIATDKAIAQERVQRSTADVRERPADELDRPRYKERWTHRGYEIRTNQFFVVANTKVEDARWAAEQMEVAWGDFGRLADAWMTSHHHSEFGIGSVQVYIDANTPKSRDLPPTTLNVVGIQTQITLNVAPGQPSLEDQLYRLRKAAGQAFLHTAELDRQLPPWACDGLASYVAAERMSTEDIKAADQQDKAPGAPRLGGQQWRFKRAEQDRLSIPTFDQDAAAQEIEFLLTGNDAAHAPDFIAAIKESIADVNFRRTQGSLVTARRGEEQPADLGAVDHLAVKLAKPFEKWQKSPLSGQPKLESEESSVAQRPPEPVLRAEREMAVVLKLARRFATTEKGTVHTRITAFDKEKGMTVLSRKAENKPAPLPELYQRMIATERPLWGTLNVHGQLVLSTNHDQLKEMLGLENNRYRWEAGSDRSVLTTTVDNQWKLQGWLEENKEDPSRPLAKFTAAKIATRR